MAEPQDQSTHPPSRSSTAAPRPTSTTTSSHQSNPSTSAAHPKPPVKADPSAIVADKASLTGTHPITVGAGAIIHPYARLDSGAGPIDIGQGSVVWERAEIGGAAGSRAGASAGAGAESEQDTDTTAATVLGANVVVSAMARVCRGSVVAANTTLDVGAVVGPGCAVGEWCRLGALTKLEAGSQLHDYGVVFHGADGQMERVNVSARDFEKVRSLELKGRERERENLVKTLSLANTMVGGGRTQ